MIPEGRSGGETAVAKLETDGQTARKLASIFAETCEDEAVATTLVDNGGGRWMVAIHFPQPPDETAVRALAETAAGAAAAQALTFERVAAKDWVRESLAGLQPVQAGRFVVHGAHDRARVAQTRIGIEIEAALAFGTGHHGTTRGCLLALERICKAVDTHRHSRPIPRHPEVRANCAPRRMNGRGVRAVALRGSLRSHLRVTERNRRILDLGTGSGVLAIAAARALRRRVLATDVDAEAVRVARLNARLNRAGMLIDMAQADGVDGQRMRARAPFDLIFANILLGPLQRFAAPLKKLIAPGGRIVLSGLLTAQANAALSAYRPLALECRIDLDGWTTLVLKRGSRPRPPVARRRRHS